MPILDVPKTLEYLESQGVPIFSFKNDTFPGFFTKDSGIEAQRRVDEEHVIAEVMCI